MKEKLVQISTLGGIYSIVSFLLGLFDNWIAATISVALFLILIVWAVCLLFIRPRKFLEKIKVNFPKISIYLICMGWLAYLSIPVWVWGSIEGYKSAQAEYNDIQYNSELFDIFSNFMNFIYLPMLMISFVAATIIVIKKSLKK